MAKDAQSYDTSLNVNGHARTMAFEMESAEALCRLPIRDRERERPGSGGGSGTSSGIGP